VAGQAEVEARAAGCHLPTTLGVSRELGDGARLDRPRGDGVGACRVYADPDAADADHLERMAQLAARIVAGGAAYGRTRMGAAPHAARVGAVDGELLAGCGLDVGEEALVAAQQAPAKPRVEPDA
jgi:hypothetical protein